MHLITNNVIYSNALQVKDHALLKRVLDLIKKLQKKVKMERRTNIMCKRGTFPVPEKKNMHTASTILGGMDATTLSCLVNIYSGLKDFKEKVTMVELRNLITTGTPLDSKKMEDRYLWALKSDTIDVYQNMSRWCYTLLTELRHKIHYSEVESYFVLAKMFNNSYMLEHRLNSLPEIQLVDRNLGIESDCNRMVKLLHMNILHYNTLTANEKLLEFKKRLVHYCMYQLRFSKILDFGDTFAADDVVATSMHLHCCDDEEFMDIGETVEFGADRHPFIKILTSMIRDRKVFYIPKGGAINGDSRRFRIKYGNGECYMDDLISAWMERLETLDDSFRRAMDLYHQTLEDDFIEENGDGTGLTAVDLAKWTI